MEVNPLSIILVKSDSKGDRLLFRYPYEVETTNDIHDQRNGKKNPYALSVIEDLLQTPMPHTSNIHKGQLTGFTDEVLSTLFAVKPELCHRKFELKVNDVRFVGHPTLLPFRANKDDGTSSTILINIVFALQAVASHSVVKCYYDLSERLGKALRHEEKRCAYLSEEMKIMIAIHDELSSMDCDSEETHESTDSFLPPSSPPFPRSPFHHILQKSTLAMSLKTVFEELSSSGVVQVRMNQWVLVSFCLPHKAHQFHNRGLIIEPETIDKCLRSLRPYHGMLLLVDPNELLDSIPLDSSPFLIRLVTLYSPLKSLQTLAIEADLTLSQVFQICGHLVYWAKATIIYPLCESNVYVIAPDAQVHLHSPFVEKFAVDFPGLCLIQVMSMLSLPAPLWFHARAWAGGAALLAKCIVWMLQRHLLLQLHTYVQFLPTPAGPPVNGTKDYFCEKHNRPRPTISDSLISLTLVPHSANPMNNSDDSSNDSFNMRTRDYNDSGFRSNKTALANSDSSLSDTEVKRGRNRNGYNNLKPILKSPNNETATKVKLENPKNVFRENSLIFGDITCESSLDSQPSTPQSLDIAHHCVKINVCDAKNRKNSDTTDSSESSAEPARKSEWTIDSSESSVNSNDNIGVDVPDFARNIIVPNFDANFTNKVIKTNNFDIKPLDVTVQLNNNNNEVSANLPHLAKVVNLVNGIHNLKVEEKNNTNGTTLHPNNGPENEKVNFTLNTSNSSSTSNISEKKFSNFKHVDTSFQPPTVISNLSHINCDVVDMMSRNNAGMNGLGSTEQFTGEMLLADFTEEEKTALFKIPAAHNPDDLNLMATLYKKGYFRGEQHLEEIMYMENLTRSQVLQLIDKFRDVLVTYETEDPAIAMLYSNPQ